MNSAEFVSLLAEIYQDKTWPRPLHVLQGRRLVEDGASVEEVAAQIGTKIRFLQPVVDASDPVVYVLGSSPTEIERESRERAYRQLGQLLLGRAAEMAFEEIYHSEMHTAEMELRDHRELRTDTDFRIFDSSERPIYRLNIKFHGALFHNARDVVGLEPEDCFALATYKIQGALKKQDQEHLPYIFVVVGVRTLSGEKVGIRIPSRLIDAAAFYYQAPKAKAKRNLEDRLIEFLVATQDPVFSEMKERIIDADWFVISARRADRLVRELLYDRVFALRVPSFTRAYRGAEVDMHFSLSEDLTPLTEFLHALRDYGHPVVVTRLERGDY